MRVNRGDRRRLVLREPGARRRLRARRSAAATCTCSGSSRTAASTRTSTTCGRCSSSPAQGMASARGSTPSPTAATSRRRRPSRDLAELPAGPDRDRRRPLLRDGPRPALGADRARASTRSSTARASTATTRLRRCEASYDAGVTDEFIEPIVLDGRPRLEPGDAAIFFNFRPDRARQLSQRLLERGFDLTTMTRYRDDLDCPVVFERAGGRARRSPRCSREHGAAPAPRRRDREVRARHLLLQRRPRGGVGGGDARPRALAARRRRRYDQKPEMSAARGGRRASARELGDGYALRGRQLREPGHGRPHGRDPGGRAGGRDGRRVPRQRGRGGRARSAASASSRPTTATPSRCSSPTASARTPRTRRTPCRSSSPDRTPTLREGGELCRSRPDRSRAARARDSPYEMTGQNLVRLARKRGACKCRSARGYTPQRLVTGPARSRRPAEGATG